MTVFKDGNACASMCLLIKIHNILVNKFEMFFFVGVHEQLFEDQPDVPPRSKAVDRYELLSFESGPQKVI